MSEIAEDYTAALEQAEARGRVAKRRAANKAEPLHLRHALYKWIEQIYGADWSRIRGIWRQWDSLCNEFGFSQVISWRCNRYCSCHMCSCIKAADRRRARHKVRRDMRAIVRTGEIPEVLPLYERNYTD